ncbi:hypothetical protein [Microbulbifer sediminum]|uniref:hypothetical protein n=1 Tax=Microbulbifer sediminum TaxID=2904250 RepID=UPI001F484B5B|nr:hypothetical protein [Microbulbifer sediminum]
MKILHNQRPEIRKVDYQTRRTEFVRSATIKGPGPDIPNRAPDSMAAGVPQRLQSVVSEGDRSDMEPGYGT